MQILMHQSFITMTTHPWGGERDSGEKVRGNLMPFHVAQNNRAKLHHTLKYNEAKLTLGHSRTTFHAIVPMVQGKL